MVLLIPVPTPNPNIALGRRDALAFMTATVILKTWTRVLDPDTGTEIETPNPDVNSRASVQKIDQVDYERDVADRIASVNRWEVLLPWDTVIDIRDKIEWEGVTYEINSSNQGENNRLVLRLECTKVT